MKHIIMIGALALVAYLFVACNDKLDVKQAYDFSLTTLPVQKQIAQGETAEIRCQLNRFGAYDDAKYFIRYFQPDGKGLLKMDNGRVLLPNDLYLLPKENFRLYYTSLCTDAQQLDITILDNFSQERELSIKFQNSNKN